MYSEELRSLRPRITAASLCPRPDALALPQHAAWTAASEGHVDATVNVLHTVNCSLHDLDCLDLMLHAHKFLNHLVDELHVRYLDCLLNSLESVFHVGNVHGTT